MTKQQSIGKCNLCGAMFGKSLMTRHLSKCKLQTLAPGKQDVPRAFHLVVEGGWTKNYWLHLGVPVKAPLSKLDDFLRRIWLECCGHMSAFEIAGIRYSRSPMMEEERGMETPLGEVLDVGTKFRHEYDFGSTTELALKVVGFWSRDKPKGAVQLLARNEPPQFVCVQCKTQPATEVCGSCSQSADAWLCESCAVDHECGEEMLLPVVNSPRVGVCGYTG